MFEPPSLWYFRYKSPDWWKKDLCQKSIHIRNNFWTLNFIPLIYMSILIPHHLDNCSFVVKLNIGKYAHLCPSFQDSFSYSGSLAFLYEFWISVLIPPREIANISIGIVWNLYTNLEIITTLTILSVPWTRNIFPFS